MKVKNILMAALIIFMNYNVQASDTSTIAQTLVQGVLQVSSLGCSFRGIQTAVRTKEALLSAQDYENNLRQRNHHAQVAAQFKKDCPSARHYMLSQTLLLAGVVGEMHYACGNSIDIGGIPLAHIIFIAGYASSAHYNSQLSYARRQVNLPAPQINNV